MRVMITGASGMLGIEVCRAAVKRFGKRNVTALTHYDLDIVEADPVAFAMDRAKPDVVINCAGLVKGRGATDKAFSWINGMGPKVLARACDARNARLVQISTDCVFAGDRPHTETDRPNATDIYGLSKLEGEIAWGNHMNLRMSFVGLGRRGLLAWLMQQTGTVDGFTRARWNGLTTPYAAERILDCLETQTIRTYHIHGRDTTKYEVLVAANEVFGLGLKIQPADQPVSDMRLRSIYPEPDMPPIRKQLQDLAAAYSGAKV